MTTAVQTRVAEAIRQVFPGGTFDPRWHDASGRLYLNDRARKGNRSHYIAFDDPATCVGPRLSSSDGYIASPFADAVMIVTAGVVDPDHARDLIAGYDDEFVRAELTEWLDDALKSVRS